MMHSPPGLTRGMNIKLDEENYYLCIDGRPWRMALPIEGAVAEKYPERGKSKIITHRIEFQFLMVIFLHMETIDT